MESGGALVQVGGLDVQDAPTDPFTPYRREEKEWIDIARRELKDGQSA